MTSGEPSTGRAGQTGQGNNPSRGKEGFGSVRAWGEGKKNMVGNWTFDDAGLAGDGV